MQKAARNRLTWLAATCLLATGVSGAPTLQYDHGSPTEAEQYAVELINRARANPAAEGVFLAGIDRADINLGFTFFSVDRVALRNTFAGYAARPPLGINAGLMSAARFQAQDQADHNYQGHVSSNGATIATRLIAAGYSFAGAGENIYTRIPDALFAHVGFNVDWGVPSLYERSLIMNLPQVPIVFKEIGVGTVSATLSNVAPNVTTQLFGLSTSPLPLLTGVVYRDVDGDGFYTPGGGEAAGGVLVMPQTGDYFAVTSASGGYTIPLRNLPPTATSVVVTFSGGALSGAVTLTVPLDGANNVKRDLLILPDFRVTQFVRPGANDAAQISFQTRVGAQYRVEVSQNLARGWGILADGISGSGGVVTTEDPAAAGSAARFYRVVEIR